MWSPRGSLTRGLYSIRVVTVECGTASRKRSNSCDVLVESRITRVKFLEFRVNLVMPQNCNCKW